MTADADEPTLWPLAKAVAWIAWRDAGRPIIPAVPNTVFATDAAALRAAKEWVKARAHHDDELERACRVLAKEAYRICMVGVRPSSGFGPGSFRGGEHVAIGESISALPYTIPLEWLAVDGGTMMFQSGKRDIDGGANHGIFTEVYVDRRDVCAVWPKPRAERDQVQAAARWLTDHLNELPGTKYSEAITACTRAGFSREVCRDAWSKIPAQHRTPRGRPKKTPDSAGK
jgi:hypothetical protein